MQIHTTKEVKQVNPLYQMFNEQYIQQQAAIQHHNQQVYEVQKSVNALIDFLNSADNIEPAYQQMASAEYCAVLAEYFRKQGLIK